MRWSQHAGRIKQITQNVTGLEWTDYLVLQSYPPQTALTDSHICPLRLETELAFACSTSILEHFFTVMMFLNAFVLFDVCSWNHDLRAMLTLLSHTRARQGSLYRDRTSGVDGIVIKWYLKKYGLKVLNGFICLRWNPSGVYVAMRAKRRFS